MGLALVESVTAHVRFVSENNISEFYRRVSKKERSIQSQNLKIHLPIRNLISEHLHPHVEDYPSYIF